MCHSSFVANSVQMNSESLVDKLLDGFIQSTVNTLCLFFLFFYSELCDINVNYLLIL